MGPGGDEIVALDVDARQHQPPEGGATRGRQAEPLRLRDRQPRLLLGPARPPFEKVDQGEPAQGIVLRLGSGGPVRRLHRRGQRRPGRVEAARPQPSRSQSGEPEYAHLRMRLQTLREGLPSLELLGPPGGGLDHVRRAEQLGLYHHPQQRTAQVGGRRVLCFDRRQMCLGTAQVREPSADVAASQLTGGANQAAWRDRACPAPSW